MENSDPGNDEKAPYIKGRPANIDHKGLKGFSG